MFFSFLGALSPVEITVTATGSLTTFSVELIREGKIVQTQLTMQVSPLDLNALTLLAYVQCFWIMPLAVSVMSSSLAIHQA